MTIRQAVLSDSSALKELLTQLGYPQEVNDVIAAIESYGSEGYHLMVGEEDGVVVGFASLHWFDMFHVRGKIGRITAICILDGLRSKGIGRVLTEACENLLVSKGCTKVEVTSNLKRTLTHKFYQQMGYTIDSQRFTKTLQPF